jgi:hypothetical protein
MPAGINVTAGCVVPSGIRARSNVPMARLFSKDETNAEGEDGKCA